MVNAQSGGLYGHIVAGDTSLHRAYIIPALDVMHDIEANFGYEPTMPTRSDSLLKKVQNPCISPASSNEAHYTSQSHKKERKIPPVVRSRQTDFFSKSWDPGLFRSHLPWVDNLFNKEVTGESHPEVYWDRDDFFSSSKYEEVEEFCRSASILELGSGTGEAGNKRGAWVDDRCSQHSLSERSVRKYHNPLTATAFYLKLQQPVCIYPIHENSLQ